MVAVRKLSHLSCHLRVPPTQLRRAIAKRLRQDARDRKIHLGGSVHRATIGQKEFVLGSKELGLLRESSALVTANDFAGLRKRLEDDGYLYIQGLVPSDAVQAAKVEVLKHIRDQGLLAPGTQFEHGVIGTAHNADQGRLQGAEKLFKRQDVQACLEHQELNNFFSKLFNGKGAITYDYKWLRAVQSGESSGFHMDTVYMGNLQSPGLLTCWIPLMAVPPELGGLTVCRGSNNLPEFKHVRDTYGRLNLDTGNVNGTGWFSEDPDEITSFGGRLETASFNPGDVVIFTMHTMHGSSVNQTDRWRLSFDVRWQPEDEPADPRWFCDANGEFPGMKSRWALHRNDPKEFPRTMEMAKRDWGLLGC